MCRNMIVKPWIVLHCANLKMEQKVDLYDQLKQLIFQTNLKNIVVTNIEKSLLAV